MNAKQYRNALDRLDLSQVAAGKLLSVDARTSRRWALGGAPVPKLVEVLLNLLITKKLELELEERPKAERRVWTLKAKESVYAME